MNSAQTHSTLQACYANGTGGPRNYQEARRLYVLASAQGYTQSIEALRYVDEAIRNNPHQTSTKPAARKKPKPNAPCPCGSDKKFKNCCWSN